MSAAPPERQPPPAADQGPLDRLRLFFSDQIWQAGPGTSRGVRGFCYALCRLGYSVVRGFLENRLTLRAAALTYFSVLSLVPFLAFAFAVLKGLGAYAGFIQGTVQPYVEHTFSGNRALQAAIEYIFRFVDRTNVSTLGVVGLLTLIYTSVSLISNVEAALNVVWGARTQRPLLRQVTDYVTLLVTTPVLVMVATTFATAAQSSQVVQFLRQTLGLGAVIDFLLRFTSMVVVGMALFAVYEILPNVRVRPASAFLGAAVSALLWQGLLVLHVQFQIGVAGYSALYSVLGAIPIFLVWTYFSWVTVLIGAQVAASHQDDRAMGERFVSRRMDQALRERLALALSAVVARDFRMGTRRTEAGLADAVRVARGPAGEVLGELVRAGVLARAVLGRDAYLLPGRDPAGIRLSDIRDALRREPGADRLRDLLEGHLPARLRAALDAAEEESRRSPQNLTLEELSQLTDLGGPEGSSAVPDERRLPPVGSPVAVDER
ncbi:MAG TPA: YihY/virulence factor BrkB family protein [Anaeromyxobacter sp.]|nr:YihY/virulence factor BrkB family protein [Anaeromyxobacter sp.]